MQGISWRGGGTGPIGPIAFMRYRISRASSTVDNASRLQLTQERGKRHNPDVKPFGDLECQTILEKSERGCPRGVRVGNDPGGGL